MATIQLDPYLFFTGNCREAMEFYQGVFGGELAVVTYGQTPGAADEQFNDKVMHALLSQGDIRLMASDSTARDHFEISRISLSLGGDEARLREIFDKLSEGASDLMPLKKESWGDIFGSFTDKFGIDWMVNISQA